MKKEIAVVLAAIMLLSVLLPVTASAGQTGQAIKYIKDGSTTDKCKSFPMSVSVEPSSSGGDDPDGNQKPIIKAKFEASVGTGNTYPSDHHQNSAYIDDDLSKAGTQVDPPMEFQGKSWVDYYVFVEDPDGNQEISMVTIDVYHPDDDNPLNPLGRDNWFKYNLVLCEKQIDQTFLDYMQAVHDAEAGGNNIICYSDGYNWDDLWFEIINGHLLVYTYHKELDYCQPAGYYKVEAHAYDIHGAEGTLTNYFEYVIGVGIETDFDSLDFGTARVSTWQWIHGDWDFGTGDPTIRSIGNWDVRITLQFGDFDMGQSDFNGEEQWNVVFDARLGDTYGDHANRSYVEKMQDLNPSASEYECSIHPDEEVVLPSDWDPRDVNSPSGTRDYGYTGIIEDDYFAKCNTSKISFGIHVRKPLYNSYEDCLIICVYIPFEYETMSDLPCGP